MLRLERSQQIDNWMLQYDTARVKASNPQSSPLWQRTPLANLIRYVPSGGLFARVRIKGKLIRRSLKTKGLSVAKLRLADLEKAERQIAEHATAFSDGKMTFEDALASARNIRRPPMPRMTSWQSR